MGPPLLQRIRAAEFDAVFLATPCSSYSVRHTPRLRSAAEPEGITPVPAEWRAYVEKHNLLADFSALAIDACRATRTPVGLENPADRGVGTSPAYWAEHAEHGSLWRMPCVARALGAYRASFATFAQCSFAAPAQKWTTIASAGGLDAPLAGLGTARYDCHHEGRAHHELLTGRDAEGRSRAGKAAAYPAALNELLAAALVAAGTAARRVRTSQAPPQASPLHPAPAPPRHQ